jgi:hypothetical protein
VVGLVVAWLVTDPGGRVRRHDRSKRKYLCHELVCCGVERSAAGPCRSATTRRRRACAISKKGSTDMTTAPIRVVHLGGFTRHRTAEASTNRPRRSANVRRVSSNYRAMGATIVIDPGGEGEAYVPFGPHRGPPSHAHRPTRRLARGGTATRRLRRGCSYRRSNGRRVRRRSDVPSVGMVLCLASDPARTSGLTSEAYNRLDRRYSVRRADRLLGVGQSAVAHARGGHRGPVRDQGVGLRGVMLPASPCRGLQPRDVPAVLGCCGRVGTSVSFHILRLGRKVCAWARAGQ